MSKEQTNKRQKSINVKKEYKNKTYRNIKRLIDKLTRTEQPNNDVFDYYEFYVVKQSGTRDYFSVDVSLKENQYDYVASFSFDYWTKEVHITDAVNDDVIMNIIEGFDNLYGKNNIKYSIEKEILMDVTNKEIFKRLQSN